jgi:hypothetical protein
MPIPPRLLERLREPSLQEFSQFGSRLELRDEIQFFECRSEVNAFERLQIVPDRISSYVGSKYGSCTVRARCFGASSLPSTNAS